ncbi:hypothetical protein E2562_003318 [Oryza meyeriana var. granulata]|uniref:At1g61320/AtMIF1 LRR domain-containing protein n=1 Tax=Oryza meyeriana var. granulata TaxID=110450 RepID=A0A6G1EGK8_9ORYZ|nr:hypothetical protein E2562_003318 [Oryza meyeriana var. granulata]
MLLVLLAFLKLFYVPGVGSRLLLHLGLKSSPLYYMKIELGPLRSLTSLRLQSVRITGDELECLLSNSLALEQLKLSGCKEIIFLKIPCVLQQLKSLRVLTCSRLQAIESEAPNLSRVYLCEGKIKFSPGEALHMKDFTLWRVNSICYARAELPSIMPNLERLVLTSCDEVCSKAYAAE